ncbi:hypothetical protein BGL34_01865 [Fructilactobacillus lindneri]|uniref:Uncharacterized protein n=2 Tax=Fructilactobacillus lindneri TaxID=53444 RepID=A0A0R2JST1_9LACO|nr:hypothetical protein [Fructilactobacillus lindneri]ANZ58085.1 hypothetical protein AYR60_04720 [Fructilactobacillus lindneri]ANZ59406.1 hypothetical protein AYR59_04975 [Fructilactobacillus lindneri]KRN78902.1 hypothetical protein IV52_GL000306 [Fructilactobacillus lindneri DSM 20690 = JCM 11027]POG98810.1 hypothetical protein BGL31_02455 [Fructilactobacillus lindneri]POH03083.1 hypothetical protein BGL33_03890 [Fructilactobacillus lindneri]
MDVLEFNFYNNLKNRLQKVQAEIVQENKLYIKKITNIRQLKNDYDVETIDQLASVLNGGNESQETEDIKNALNNHDKSFLVDNMKNLDHEAYETINDMKNEEKDVAEQLESATKFYKEFVMPILGKMKSNRLIRIDSINSSGNNVDTYLEIDYFSTFDDFKEDFKAASFVPEVIEKHLKDKTSISVIFTEDNYPNKYDITFIA